jgi:hypothetical protein
MRAYLLLLAFVTACGGGAMQMKTVSAQRWQKVPASERGTIDKSRADELAKATADEQRASADLAKARLAIQATPAIHAKPATDAGKDALSKVDAARVAWLQAGVTWRVRRLEAAQLHVVALECARELERAEAIDARTHDDDFYDTSDFRAQHGHAQEAWFVAEARATDARKAYDHAMASMGDAKDAYATAARDELETAQVDAASEAPPKAHLLW